MAPIYSRDELISAFDYWFRTSGHWIYRDRAHAFKTWQERGIEGLPDYPK